jgi:hypothetical protein
MMDFRGEEVVEPLNPADIQANSVFRYANFPESYHRLDSFVFAKTTLCVR